MSDAHDIDGRFGPPGRPRPPGGPTFWPPAPAGTWPRPPDWYSGLYWLDKAWDDVRATKAFLKRVIQELVEEDPSLLGLAQPIVGVTDGSSAQPGMVGEFFLNNTVINYPAGASTQTVSAGILQPGDWDVWAWLSFSDTTVQGAEFRLLPEPPGFSSDLHTALGTPTNNTLTLASTTNRALLSAPTLLVMWVWTNDAGPGGQENLQVCARRRR